MDGATTLIPESLLHQWTDDGASRVLARLDRALKATPAGATAASADRTLYRLLYELVWIVLHAKLPRQDVLTLLTDAQLAKSQVGSDVLVDILWVIGNEVEAKEKGRERYSSPQWQTLTKFVRDLAEHEIVSGLQLKSSLELDVLHHAGLLPDPVVMSRKLIRVNTKTYYTQVKFNLLREESEGFAKVLSLLHTGINRRQIATSKTDLMALIGYFDLDANRVLDLVLDAYEMQPGNDYFTDVLSLFKSDSIPHVLGFKFQFYKREAGERMTTPRSLYRLAATLIDKKLLELEALMPHLAPTSEETVKFSVEKVKELEKAAKAFGKVNLTGKPIEGSEVENGATADEVEKAASELNFADNQVYGLIIGLLEIGSKDRAFELIRWFKDRGADPLTYAPLMAEMCAYVQTLLVKLYEPLSLKAMTFSSVDSGALHVPSSCITPLLSSDDWMEDILPVLTVLGSHLHNEPVLFTKILRVVNSHIERKDKEHKEDSLEQLKPWFISSFFPALSLQSCNPSTAFQIWDLLKLYPFEERYRLYQQWQSLYSRSPVMQLTEVQCVQATRKIMRRLTADRAKPSARSLTHIAHSNPLVVFRTMLRQIQSYDNLIQPVVESFKFITPLGMDVLSFVLVTELSKSRQSMKADGTNISLWLTSLANFSGSFYRKYPNVELAGLLRYLIQRLQNWESVDLVVLSELLSKMGSCITFEDISESQLEAQAGGPHLWHEPSDPKLTNRRAIPRLRDALIKRDLALPLCLLICQVCSKMEFQEDSAMPHLKLLGRMYDTSQMTLSQLLQFLNGVVDPEAYARMLPSLFELVHDYHILPALAMTICRPAIRADDALFKHVPRSVHPTGSISRIGSDRKRVWDMHSAEVIDDIAKAVATETSTDPFTGMTKEMYVTFWSMILYDIHVPFPQYEAEITRLRSSISSGQGTSTSQTSAERKKLKEKTTQMIDKLMNEQKDQVAHRKRVYERLEEKKSLYFRKEDANNQTAVKELLQKCIIPRALMSPEDALFSAKFMERIHKLNVPDFRSVQYYNKVALQLPSLVLCVTEREAGNFGIFLRETLGLLYRWYQSSATYEEEAIHGKTGFSIDLQDPKKVLPHRQYKSMYAKCHRSMVALYSKTLSSGEYMPIRNSLIVLTKLIDVFPSGRAAAECLLDIVEHLTKEDREDIKIMARRYFALLTKRKSSLVVDKMLSAGLPAQKKEKEPVVDGDSRDVVVQDESQQKEKPMRPDKIEPKEMSKETTTSGEKKSSREAPPSNGSGSRSDRHSASREDLESGEVQPELKEKREKPLHSAALKRRDSDRGDAGTRSAPDDKRDRRMNEREAVPPKPSVRHEPNDSGSASGPRERATSNESMALKRDGVRETHRRSRSRSADSRRVRERTEKEGREKKVDPTLANTAVAQEKREPSTDRLPSNDSSESRKRQRAESTEAALRRQLTEKKAQGSRNSSVTREGGEVDAKERRESSGRTNVEAPRNQDPPRSEPPKKIVSLVSSRKRERESSTEPSASSGMRSNDDGGPTPDQKRRREGAPHPARDDAGHRTERGEQPSQSKRQPDDKKRPPQHPHRQPSKQKHDGGGNQGGGQQSREQSRGRPEQRHHNRNDNASRGGGGGSGSGNGDRRRDSHSGNGSNADRRGGGGGGRR